MPPENNNVPVEETVIPDTPPEMSEYEHLCSLLADMYERMERIESHLDTASRDDPPAAAKTAIEEAKEEVAQEKTTIEQAEQDIPKSAKRVTFLW